MAARSTLSLCGICTLDPMETEMNANKRAEAIVVELLRMALNRHVDKLNEAGYLRGRRHSKDYGFRGSEFGPSLQLKNDLIDEMCDRFVPSIAEYISGKSDEWYDYHETSDAET